MQTETLFTITAGTIQNYTNWAVIISKYYITTRCLNCVKKSVRLPGQSGGFE